MQLPILSALALASLPLRIITHNVRFATSSLKPNEKPWSERRPLIASQLRYHTRFIAHQVQPFNDFGSSDGALASAFICLQEVLHGQLVDILTDLNALHTTASSLSSHEAAWAHIGVGREDGRTEGEYSPILYSSRDFDLVHSETIWLSPTPEKPSKGWDAGDKRILTVGIFRHKATERHVLVCNTHLDNSGSESRRHSVAVILSKIDKLRKQWKEQARLSNDPNKSSELPVVLAGDFNSFPTQEAYLAMQASPLMYDLHNRVPPEDRYGDGITFTGFDPDVEDSDRGRIDFIWLGPKSSGNRRESSTDGKSAKGVWGVLGYSVLPNFFNDVFCSDHKAVVGDVVLS